jgi:Fe-S-cluster containining protein
MIIVQGILISDDLVEEHFVCQLDQCKGACCWEGDFGAPLEPEEIETIEKIYSKIKALLPEESISHIEANGKFDYYKEPGFTGTQLMKDGACVFMTKDKNGIAQCGFELANALGITDFRKPISCHLYPVRIKKNEGLSFEALNYDRWDICSAACSAGKKIKLPLYRFVKDALVRKYGAAFYEELDAAARYISSK